MNESATHRFVELDDLDCNQVASLSVEAVGNPSPEKLTRVRAAYSNPNRRLIGLMVGAQLIGLIGIDLKAQSRIYIRHLAVTPAQRLQGNGRKLVEGIFRDYRPASVQAETDSDAVDFYRKMNFAVKEKPQNPGRRPRFICTRESTK